MQYTRCSMWLINGLLLCHINSRKEKNKYLIARAIYLCTCVFFFASSSLRDFLEAEKMHFWNQFSKNVWLEKKTDVHQTMAKLQHNKIFKMSSVDQPNGRKLHGVHSNVPFKPYRFEPQNWVICNRCRIYFDSGIFGSVLSVNFNYKRQKQ